jgi:hypothetical protein
MKEGEVGNFAHAADLFAVTKTETQALDDIKQVLQAHGYRCRRWKHKLFIRTPGWRYELFFEDGVWTLEPWNSSQRYQQLIEVIGMSIVQGERV